TTGAGSYFGFATTRRMLATRDSNSIGFHSELIAARRNGGLALARLLICGQANDRDVAGLAIRLETMQYFPTVIDRHFEVHQNDVRVLGRGQPVTLLTIIGHDKLEVIDALKAHLEHVAVMVVVFDAEDFGHRAASILVVDGRSPYLALDPPSARARPHRRWG